MNAAAVLDLLVDQYATVPAPAPRAELAARMDAGWIGAGDHDRGAVVVPFVARPRARVRYLVAAMVATFVVGSGLAVAGALPDPTHRAAASVVSHLGIDLPTPDSSSPADTQGGGNHPSSPNGSSPTGGSTSGGHGGEPAGKSTTPPTSTTGLGTGSLGGLGVIPTVPPTTLPPGVSVPPLSLPPVTVAPLSDPPPTMPPLTIPTVPPLELPGL